MSRVGNTLELKVYALMLVDLWLAGVEGIAIGRHGVNMIQAPSLGKKTSEYGPRHLV